MDVPVASLSTTTSSGPVLEERDQPFYEDDTTSIIMMDHHIEQLAINLKSILQQFFTNKKKRNYEIFLDENNEHQQYLQHHHHPDNQTILRNNDDESYDKQIYKKQYYEVDTVAIATEEEKESKQEQQQQEQQINKEEINQNELLIYETAVVKYRGLRNEIPLLTDAAYDIDAAAAATATTANNEDNLPGPLVKSPPPGRGRRKTLSIINTPLPPPILELFKKQKRKINFDPCNLIFPRPFRILFIDDSLVTLRLTAKRFQKAGFWIETSTNGEEALNLLTGNHQYDIVLTDLNMPIMSGVEIAIALRKFEENSKQNGGIIRRQFLIGTSCDTGNQASDEALAAGMDIFLAKPFTPSDLKLLVQPNTKHEKSHEGIDDASDLSH